MHLKTLTLQHYRNLEDMVFRPGEGVNIITGLNAQGKTNLIEAIYLCCTGRSHRTARDAELIHRAQDSAYVDCVVARRDGLHRIQLGLNATGRKALKINGLPATRIGELMGHANAVMFSPEDLELVKGGPALRRRFMNMELSQTDRVYFYDLQTYQRALAQRNALLKSIAGAPSLADTLDIWDEQLARCGARISRKRRDFLDKLALHAGETHLVLTGGSQLSLSFHSSTTGDTEDEAFEELLSRLRRARTSDIRQCLTSVGPHREDIAFSVDGMDMKLFASQGQKRSIALSLKLAELKIMEEETGEKPMLLLDDVFSELDEERRQGLLRAIGDTQTFIACVRVEAEIKALGQDKQFYTMRQGKLTRDA